MVQVYDDGYKLLAEITTKNNKEYCDKHGYDYIVYPKNITDEKSATWQKYPAVKRHLRNYKWVLFLDADAMIMNYNVKLQDLVDNKYDMIMENMGDTIDQLDSVNGKYIDMNYNPIASAMIFKNSKISVEFMNDVYNNILNCNELQYDNSPVKCVLGYFDKYKKVTKMFPADSKKLNAVWYTNKPDFILRDGPKWNDNGNMYEIGDFILHIVAYNIEERVSLAKQFLPYIIKD